MLLYICCSQAEKFKRCVENVRCSRHNVLYLSYLSSLGIANASSFLCENNTLSGSTDSSFYERMFLPFSHRLLLCSSTRRFKF